MTGLEFARCLTAGGHTTVLVHAAPAGMTVEVREDGGALVAQGQADRSGDYTPITRLDLVDGGVRRAEIWPDSSHHGLPVLLVGGEVGLLRAWQHAPDRSWWRWSVEFSNHTDRPPDWSPDAA